MPSPTFVIDQLEEALEERECSDRRITNNGTDPDSGENRRQGDRRDAPQQG